MTSTTMYEQSRRRIVRICETEGNARTLRLRILDEIRLTVGFDAYAWLLTDPETSVGSAPLADVPCLSELPRLIRLKYLTDINRWTALDNPPVASLQQATGGHLSRSRLWRELLDNYAIVDIASTVFEDRFGYWGFLDLWRSGDGSPFNEAAMTFLANIVEPITLGLRRCQANTFVLHPSHDPLRDGPVVLLLSPDLTVAGQTPSTHEYLRALVPPATGEAPIPASAYNVAAQLLAVEAGIDGHPPMARVHVSDGLWVTLSAARIGSSGPQNIAVTISETVPAERLALFARAFGLSVRETELLNHLMTGFDTHELARLMFLSEHTVQDHLKSIFAKTSTRNRRTLLSRALGT